MCEEEVYMIYLLNINWCFRVQVRSKMLDKYVREGPMTRGPKFLARLRSHTVFENTPVKLFCTVEGYPTPVIKW